MATETIKYYEVGDCYDTEGRGPYKAIANFYKEEIAKEYAKGRGNYNQDAHVEEKVLIVADNIRDMENFVSEEKLQKALAKLTKEEQHLVEAHYYYAE